MVSGVEIASLAFDRFSSFSVQECVLARGSEGTVWDYGGPPSDKRNLFVDMTNNDWGTTERDTIEAMINVRPTTVVNYIPYIGMPVATEGTSWGDLKAMYR